ncbi:ABC transporter ATP-binding protein [Alicyclobacillus sp.]|uniref:ABC transporter ATP-binding protein n=1 Tax=Alicyclobacillus sp. TaxID=61169 RepID=UPI0025BF920B|nr:ABC transporter ATP-binding protein [Alicyclobacillus sp.]MCL6517900.1 ABC transporter ATP-binding protein [Alicyclobacillus sp.]
MAQQRSKLQSPSAGIRQGAAVEVRHVSRRFRLGSEDVWAVRDISLTVQPGEFLALIGRSGSGKTTLLNLIAGLDRPTEGEVLIDGRRVDTMSDHDLNELRRHTLGFIFQSFGLLPLLSAQENVELPLRIAGFKHGERVRRARRVLEMVGLSRRAEHRPYELSGGEQQRVAIARALATEPTLILADEPTGELDSATATAIFTLLREIARSEGVTIIAATHDRLVMELADRVEELVDGRRATEGTQEVWRHVQARARSPFAAPLPAEAAPADVSPQPVGTPRLSSLVGADIAQFRPPAGEPARDAAPVERDAPLPEAEAPDTALDDISRWAPPERR